LDNCKLKFSEGKAITSLLETILLAVVQGVTEWLPISSSGHLALIQQQLDIKRPVFLDVMLHVGTLVVILIVFRQDIKKICKAVFAFNFRTEEGKLVKLVIVGSIPIAIIGLLFSDVIEDFFLNPFPVAVAFICTGILLFLTKWKGRERNEITYLNALLVGVAQAFALIPGVSRSGLTIAVALLLGVERTKAAKFSFILAIPAVIGAAIKESLKCNFMEVNVSSILIGVLIAMIVGYFTLKLLLGIVRKSKLHWFSPYCWLVGATVLIMFYLNS